MAIDDIIETVQKLSSRELEKLLDQRQAEEKAIRTLWRAAIARERTERKLQRESGRDQ